MVELNFLFYHIVVFPIDYTSLKLPFVCLMD